jgi:hypothetical protein
MTFVFFFCPDCKTYVSAGDKWASSKLVGTGIVKTGSEIDLNAVWDAEGYWNPPQELESRWLYEEALPPVRQFLLDHVDHRIVFGTRDNFLPDYSEDILEWLQLGYMSQPKPRFLAEVLGFKTWDQVREYMADYKQKHERLPYWYEHNLAYTSELEKWRQGFEKLVRNNGS